MQRGAEALSGGLGPQLAGEKINVNRRVVSVVRQLGEGQSEKVEYIFFRLHFIFHYALVQFKHRPSHLVSSLEWTAGQLYYEPPDF